jgi:hypothetical protein
MFWALVILIQCIPRKLCTSGRYHCNAQRQFPRLLFVLLVEETDLGLHEARSLIEALLGDSSGLLPAGGLD